MMKPNFKKSAMTSL